MRNMAKSRMLPLNNALLLLFKCLYIIISTLVRVLDTLSATYTAWIGLSGVYRSSLPDFHWDASPSRDFEHIGRQTPLKSWRHA